MSTAQSRVRLAGKRFLGKREPQAPVGPKTQQFMKASIESTAIAGERERLRASRKKENCAAGRVVPSGEERCRA
jgi:hypothetical protein